jgi:DNA repair protein RadC
MADRKVQKVREYIPINKWPESERPREKMMNHGAAALSPAELIAILIGSGTQQLSAVDVGKNLLSRFGGLETLASATMRELVREDGIGPARAITLMAAFQLGKRLRIELAQQQVKTLRQPSDVAAVFIPRLGHLKQEVFAIAMLDTAGKLIGTEEITQGTLNASLVHPREIFRPAIRQSANSVILVHNHPSGQLQASREDLAITRQLVEAGKLVDIAVLDHLIIAGDQFISLREQGQLGS